MRKSQNLNKSLLTLHSKVKLKWHFFQIFIHIYFTYFHLYLKKKKDCWKVWLLKLFQLFYVWLTSIKHIFYQLRSCLLFWWSGFWPISRDKKTLFFINDLFSMYGVIYFSIVVPLLNLPSGPGRWYYHGLPCLGPPTSYTLLP